MVLRTTDAGATWSKSFPNTPPLGDISCPSTRVCIVIGPGANYAGLDPGTVLFTNNGGDSRNHGHVSRSGKLGNFYPAGVDCPALTRCFAVGGTGEENTPGVVLGTTDGGASWTSQARILAAPVNDIDCAAVQYCAAVGGNWHSLLRWGIDGQACRSSCARGQSPTETVLGQSNTDP